VAIPKKPRNLLAQPTCAAKRRQRLIAARKTGYRAVRPCLAYRNVRRFRAPHHLHGAPRRFRARLSDVPVAVCFCSCFSAGPMDGLPRKVPGTNVPNKRCLRAQSPGKPLTPCPNPFQQRVSDLSARPTPQRLPPPCAPPFPRFLRLRSTSFQSCRPIGYTSGPASTEMLFFGAWLASITTRCRRVLLPDLGEERQQTYSVIPFSPLPITSRPRTVLVACRLR